jgi:hypothetical protein
MIARVALVSVWLAACGSTQGASDRNETTSESTSGGESHATRASRAPSSGEPARAEGLDVQSSGSPAPNDTSFDITARSDLPERVPSTNRPYAAIVADAVAPLRDAIIGCMDRMPASARPRFYALVVETDGSLHARSPQPVPLPPRVVMCTEGVIASVTVQPSPPRPFAHDLFLTEPSPPPERSR